MKHDTQSMASPDAIDRILASDDTLDPSSGFLAGVMERVREEAIAPKPIPFPWKRAVPGMVLVAGTIGWLIYEFMRMALADTLSATWTSPIALPHIPSAAQQSIIPALWTGIALAISLVSWAFSRRLTRRSSIF